MLNPNKKIAESKGIDIPIMHVYLAGRIAGNCIDKCLEWRNKIANHYKNYNGKGVYPISFLDALNSKESDSVDKQGLTSAIPPNLIYDKDLMSVKKADVVVANMEDYMEEGIEDLLKVLGQRQCSIEEIEGKVLDALPDENGDLYYPEKCKPVNFKEAFYKLQNVIKNRRPNYGTNSEVAWALLMNKPLILIAGSKERKRILEFHPFMKRASVIVETVDELLENKWLNILYKSMAGATYE